MTTLEDLEARVAALEAAQADYRAVLAAVNAALAAMRRDERRQVAAAEARAIKDDPADLEEIRAIQQDRAAIKDLLIRALER